MTTIRQPRPAVSPAAVAAPDPPAGRGLRYGMADADYGRRDPGDGRRGEVRQLQRDLALVGRFDSPHGATGGYFAATRAAVRAFQAQHGLRPTGQADGPTLAALRGAVKARGESPETAPPAARPVSDRDLAREAVKPRVDPILPPDTYTPRPGAGTERLRAMSQAELARLGKTDKQAFFAALRPSAEEVERRYGIPVAVTLAQIAYESGWGKHVPGGDSFNLFGHKGRGPAGSVSMLSWECGRTRRQRSSFRKYHNFHEAILAHGENYRKSGYYRTAIAGIDRGERDPRRFLQRIEGIYHRDGGSYTAAAMGIIKAHRLA